MSLEELDRGLLSHLEEVSYASLDQLVSGDIPILAIPHPFANLGQGSLGLEG
jgi:hypothetical protein